MTRAFLYVAIAAGVCALQATAIQAEEKKPGHFSLSSTALQGSTPGTAVTDSAQVDSDGAVAGLAEKEKEIKVLPLFGKLAWRASKNPGARIFLKIGYGTLTGVVGAVAGLEIEGKTRNPDDYRGEVAGPPFLPIYYGFLFGWPIGVYGADPWESSFWMTAVGQGVGWWTARKGMTAWWATPGFAIIASELSRLAPKEMRNPNPLKWLFGKVRRPDARVSFGLVPEPRRGLSARATATLRF